MRGPGDQWVPGSGPASRARARAPDRGARGGSALRDWGDASTGEPLKVREGRPVCEGPVRACEERRRAPRGAGSTCLPADAGSQCSADNPGTRCERGCETERPVSVRLPLFICLLSRRFQIRRGSEWPPPPLPPRGVAGPAPYGREGCARPAACSRTPTQPPLGEASVRVLTIEMPMRVFYSPRTPVVTNSFNKSEHLLRAELVLGLELQPSSLRPHACPRRDLGNRELTSKIYMKLSSGL